VARFCDSLFASLRSCLAGLSIRDAMAEFGLLLRCHRVHRCMALAGTHDHYSGWRNSLTKLCHVMCH